MIIITLHDALTVGDGDVSDIDDNMTSPVSVLVMPSCNTLDKISLIPATIFIIALNLRIDSSNEHAFSSKII